MKEIFSFFIVLNLVFVGYLAPLIFAGCILNRIDRAARRRQQAVKIYLVDFFSLLFLIQLPLAIVFQLENRQEGPAIMLAAIFCGLMALVWWVTIKTVSKAGIFKVSTRAWISLLVIPMTYVGSFTIVGLTAKLMFGTFDRHDGFGLPFVAGAEILLIGLMVWSWFVARHAVNQANPK